MRLALWTPRPARFTDVLRAKLPDGVSLEAVDAAPAAPADLDIYHVADHPEHAFVYRALLQRPGLVVLDDFSLHGLVYSETAGRGDVAGYLRAARRWGGARGAFLARQVLRGVGGELVSLFALNDGVLEAALGIAATSEPLRAALERRLRDRPLVLLPPDGPAAAAALVALARELAPQRPALLLALDGRREGERTPCGRALAELRPLAREIGLPDVPAPVAREVERLLCARPRPAGAPG